MFKWLMSSAKVPIPMIVLVLIGIAAFDVGMDKLREFKEIITVGPSRPPGAAPPAPAGITQQPQAAAQVSRPPAAQPLCDGKEESVFLEQGAMPVNKNPDKCKLYVWHEGICLSVWYWDRSLPQTNPWCAGQAGVTKGRWDVLPDGVTRIAPWGPSTRIKYMVVPR